MPQNLEAEYVSLQPESQRPVLDIQIRDHHLTVEFSNPVEIGFTAETALEAKRTFAQDLYRLSKVVAKQQPAQLQSLHDTLLAGLEAALGDKTAAMHTFFQTVVRGRPAADLPAHLAEQIETLRATLRQALTLDDRTARRYLWRLRKVGAALRRELSEDAVDELHYNGFLAGEAVEPALVFHEDIKRNGAKASIQWELLYELPETDEEDGEDQEKPEESSSSIDWERFWGFFVPISHWGYRGRTHQIRLQNGLLSAINEQLRFAGQEVDLIANQLHLGQNAHCTLKMALLDEVKRKHSDPGQVEMWLQSENGGPAPWLQRFFKTLREEEAYDEVEIEDLKEDLLAYVFKNRSYDLLHFACHCYPDENLQYFSRLEMKVGGEPLSLDVSFITTRLNQKVKSAQDPGPFIFLNACGTGEQPAATEEPPGFVDKWIHVRGALAVVATVCPVPDYFAHAFALKFYEILFRNATDGSSRSPSLAEVLLETRRYFMQEFNNPLGLAYVLYAVRDSHVAYD